MSVLNKYNVHERDTNIVFYEDGHRYDILTDLSTPHTSVTTLVHKYFPKFDADDVIRKMMSGKKWDDTNIYWGMTPSQIKKTWSDNGKIAALAGTKLHYNIELFMNNSELSWPYNHSDLIDNYDKNKNIVVDIEEEPSSIEWMYFLNFIRDHSHMKPYRTEWLIYHEGVNLAGSIDMVYEHEDGELSIYDWKRCKDISRDSWGQYAMDPISDVPHCNFWHYSLQLNIYGRILEEKYGKKIKYLYLVRLHPNADSYELIRVPFMRDELDKLWNIRIKKT